MQPRESCRTAFVEHNILIVVSLYILQVIMYSLGENLTRGSDLHTHNTRNAANFNLLAHRLALFEEKPSCMGAKLFNILPDRIRCQSGSQNFKKELRIWLLSHPFYTIEEFLNWRT
uniref:Uncharacterized protein n=1 Tax=Graphocephala atropunctata TaxID=36148 RepID=A0A1B6LLK8_9HEMI